MNIEANLQTMLLPKVYQRNGANCFLDPYREKLIPATPEEFVRQKVAAWLEKELGVPNRVIIIEQRLSHYGIKSKDRADIVVHRDTDDGMLPLAVVECKADNIFLSDTAIKQVIRYADAMECDYMFLTNGMELLCYQYDDHKKQYLELSSVPTYLEMLAGKSVPLAPQKPLKRPSLAQMRESSVQEKYLEEWIVGSATDKEIVPHIINLFECLMDTSHRLPEKNSQLFTLVQDYGVRMMSYGNAAGYTYYAPYRSFLIRDNNGSHQFVSLGFNAYGNDKTILCVAIDDYKKSHHALQFLMDTYMTVVDKCAAFWHSGRIAVGHQGSGSAAELKRIIAIKCPNMMKNEKIVMGTCPLDKILYMDDAEICNFVYTLIDYALLRDEYRNELKQKKDELT